MPDTADHRADMFALAQARRNAGLPVWDRKIDLKDVFHNDAMSFEEIRDEIVRRLRGSRWLKDYPDGSALHDLIDELADATDGNEFDGPWDQIYDYADADRVWIATI